MGVVAYDRRDLTTRQGGGSNRSRYMNAYLGSDDD
jgi:hypothetical protein